MRILVIEDEAHLAQSLQQIIASAGYSADTAHDGPHGLAFALSGYYDVIIMDILLPVMNGFEILTKLRRTGNETPVIILSAKSETKDKVRGLDSGANYYLTKPFSPEELLACIRLVSRTHTCAPDNDLVCGDTSLNLSTHVLQHGRSSIHLSNKEFDLMRLLMQAPERLVSRTVLIRTLWGTDGAVPENNLEAYVSFLRKKLSFLHSDVVIRTMRKQGYYLENRYDQ